ncbi:putative membrane protein (plasmid) [Haloferax volcanii]|nr:putative membrane protein [Haloferax lucentense]
MYMFKSDNNAPNTVSSSTQEPTRFGSARRVIATTAILSIVLLAQPAAAQQGVICSADKLPGMIEGFFQISTTLGIIGLVIVWQADSLAEVFTMSHDQKKSLKRHKLAALKSALILAVLGPLYTVVGSMLGLPMAQCVNLAPW